MAMQTGLRASYLKKILMSAGIGYTGWSFVRNGGFSDAASCQISATTKCLTEKTENMDAKPDGDNMSELSEERTSKSVYNEATKKCLTQKTANMDAKPDGDNMSELSEEKTLKSVCNEVERARIYAMFEQWVIDHNRMYHSEGEKQHRFGIFYSNIKKIEAHNSSCDSCKRGLTPFTDLTHGEFRRKYCGGYRGPRVIRVN